MRKLMIACTAALPLAIGAPVALGAYNATQQMRPTNPAVQQMGHNGAVQDAREQVSEAARMLQQMQQDPQMKAALARAKGVLLMPDYGRGGLVVGASGSPGVLMIRQNGKWIGPALYNVGSVSIGAQAGGEAGQVAMLLMTDKGVRRFEQQNNFSLKADAGLSIVNWSARAQANTGADVVVWTDVEGAYAGASVGATDINFDEGETGALYGKQVRVQDIFAGNVHTAHADALVKALPTG